jgi:hypothetical protein
VAPSHLVCPVSGELFWDPVMTDAGHTYERESLARWFERHSTDPVTNTRLRSKAFLPNYAIRTAADELRQRAVA